jgi:hypothetical protein
MGLLDTLGDFVSGVCNVVCSVVSTIGSAVKDLATGLITAVKELPLFQAISKLITFIGKRFGVFKPDENVEDIGAMAMESDKKPEDFDSTEDYIQHLRENVEFDKEKFEGYSNEKKLACKAIGASIATKGVAEKIGNNLSPIRLMGFWIEAEKQKFSDEEVGSLIDNFKKDNLDFQLSDYLKGNLKVDESKSYLNSIASALRESNPDIKDDEILDRISKMKNNSRNN